MKTKQLLFTGFVFFFPWLAFAQWSAPTILSPFTTAVGTNENAGQCIAVTGDTVRIVYSDRSTVPVKIMYDQSPDAGNTWAAPTTLQVCNSCGFSAIATFGASVHVVWMDSLGGTRASFYKRSLDGGLHWDPAVVLDSVTKFWPGIACSGNLVIATLNKDLSGNTEVFIKRSLDNGANWLPEQQISHALNRSEDPAISILGQDVHLSWNDKRSGIMNIYYCHSADGGATWGTETALTSADSYTSMVCLNGSHVDVPLGIRNGNYFHVWLAESADTGSAFASDQQLTNTTGQAEIYPFMARDSLQMHVVYTGAGGANYLHSADGGLTWDTPVLLSPAGQPFIAYTGCVLHVIFSNGGRLNYIRNPTGNGPCASVATSELNHPGSSVSIYPNPFSQQTTIDFGAAQRHATVTISDILGQTIQTISCAGRQLILEQGAMPAGYILCR